MTKTTPNLTIKIQGGGPLVRAWFARRFRIEAQGRGVVALVGRKGGVAYGERADIDAAAEAATEHANRVFNRLLGC